MVFEKTFIRMFFLSNCFSLFSNEHTDSAHTKNKHNFLLVQFRHNLNINDSLQCSPLDAIKPFTGGFFFNINLLIVIYEKKITILHNNVLGAEVVW